jgi:Calcineurin-like phosphoesterase
MRRFLASLLTAVALLSAAPSARVLAQVNPQPGTQAAAQTAVGSRVGAGAPVRLALPLREGSVRFAVIGDTGTGTPKQYELGGVMVSYRRAFPFEFVLMMGDNPYNGESAEDYKKKFEDVYKTLLDDGVKFYATLGNHDESNQRFYANFNMNGEEYYNFKKGNISFYSLNSNYMDKKQLKWMEEKLAADASQWKVAFFHHPPYSSGKKHGSSTGLREVVEPLFLKYGVNVVFAGHEHFYERVKPQKGVYYFISGAGGKLRDGNIDESSPLTAKGYDADMSFMLIEVAGDEMHFQCVNRLGETVDSGVIANQRAKGAAASSSN